MATTLTGVCSCYHQLGRKAVCYGTKEMEECNCGGDRTKCNFYPPVNTSATHQNGSKKATADKLNTAEMWITAQDSGKIYVRDDVLYSKELGFVDIGSFDPVNMNEFDLTLSEFFDEGLWSEYEAAEIMTIEEAEKKFNIRIRPEIW